MTAEEAFLQAIIASPDDDTPRLIFADWLEEHGQPLRAEFIRVQISLARLPEHDPRRQELRERSAQLQEHCREWLGPLAELANIVWFQRGFAAGICTDIDTYLRHAEVLAQRSPLRHAEFRCWGGDSDNLARLNACPQVHWLETIELSFGCCDLNDHILETLARLPLVVERLWKLSALEANVSTAGLRALLLSAHLRRLQRLSLDECGLEGVEEVRVLAESPRLSCLTSLRLGDNRLGDDAVRLLVSSPNLRHLTSLSLDECEVGDEGARALAQSPHLSRLYLLDLHNNTIRNPGAHALARTAGLPALKWLDLSNNRIGDSGAGALVTSPHRRGLETLILGGNRISTAREKDLKIRLRRRVFF